MQLLFRLCLICMCIMTASLKAEIKGRADVGPTLLSIDMLESGKTAKTLHMKGVKGDASFILAEGRLKGLGIKPSFLYGWGDGKAASGSIALGFYIPATENFCLFPQVGHNWSYLESRIDLYVGLDPVSGVKERFRSTSVFIGFDFSYTFHPKWTLIGTYQYAWCRTHTKIKPFFSDKSHSCGSNYSLGLEYSLDNNWALSLGAGYNISLSKEKHGLRGKGAKFGIVRYF